MKTFRNFNKLMQIQFFQNQIITNNPLIQNRQFKSPLSPLPYDTVSFCAIKKSSLKDFDLACTNMFKAPLAKFRSLEDFKLWTKEELEKLFNFDSYKGPNKDVTVERNKILQEWKDYLQEENNIYINDPALSSIIFSAIVKDLGKNDANLPPLLNKGVLANTVDQIGKRLKMEGTYQFNFNKIYQNNLRMYYTKDIESLQTLNGSAIEGWIKIPSKDNDPENFNENVKKLKSLSHKSWCTKSTHAETYLSDGDFCIYYEKGYPKVGIRFKKGYIIEIQGEENNCKIPVLYLEEIKRFIDKNKFKGKEADIKITEINKEELETLKLDIKESIDKKDYKKILEYFGIEVKVLEDKTLEISHYKQPFHDVSFKDLGIDENDLFKNISRIEGNADFSKSQMEDLGNLQSIGGDADFSRKSLVKNLGNLRSIGGNADFSFNNKIKTLDGLQSIGGNTYFSHSEIEKLGNDLKSIGGDAWFNESTITDLGGLQSIGGNAYFVHHSLRSDKNYLLLPIDLNNLQSIGGDAYIGEKRFLQPKQVVKINGRIYK